MNYLAILILSLSIKTGGNSSAKTVESKMVQVTESLYASKFEVSNFEYHDFLKDMESKGVNISHFQIKEENWLGISSGEPLGTYYGSHPAFDNYPVVNISYTGAAKFCDWLTEKYHADPKRKFSEVRFRLPSKDEWITAASSGNEKAIFPWNTPYPA